MKYKCLVLDHDDTAVQSTPQLHYPSFRMIMEDLRPGEPIASLAEFTRKCFEPGYAEYCRDELGFTDEEMKAEYKIWKEYIHNKTPEFYDGILDIVRRFKAAGGYVCVVSLSEEVEIKRHYKENGFEPDLVYGWSYPKEQQKPNPFPMEDILAKLGLEPKDAIMVDDLRLGYDMAAACGVDFAAAGWSHGLLPEVADFMREKSDYYFSTVKEFEEFLYG